MDVVGGIDSNNATVAISSGNKQSNLFIYDLDICDKYLSHQLTITLPNIHGLKWVPKNPGYLVTGNNKGYAHLISIPSLCKDGDDEDASAEIVKRFNHRKHLKSSSSSVRNSNISKLDFIDQESNELLSLYDNNLFHWNLNGCQSQIRPSPISITTITGLVNFDPLNSATVGICGRFGVSLFDLRTPKFQLPKSLSSSTNKKKQYASLMKWNPDNDNVFAAYHRDGVIRLWDIRKQESYGNLFGHHDKVVSMEWNSGDLFSGGRDGNIIHWDLTTDGSDLSACSLKEGLTSINFDGKTNKLKHVSEQRQCGTILPASNTNIITMKSINDGQDTKILSVDGSSFFGVHNKIYDAVNINVNSDKFYYSEQDLQLLVGQVNSTDTLVEEEPISDKLTTIYEAVEPLSIARKPTMTTTNYSPGEINSSTDTLAEEFEPQVNEKHHSFGLESEVDEKESQASYVLDLPEFDEFKFDDDHNGSLISLDSSRLNLVNGSLETVSTNPTIVGHEQNFKFEQDVKVEQNLKVEEIPQITTQKYKSLLI
jgi:WD40 repeat protein